MLFKKNLFLFQKFYFRSTNNSDLCNKKPFCGALENIDKFGEAGVTVLEEIAKDDIVL